MTNRLSFDAAKVMFMELQLNEFERHQLERNSEAVYSKLCDKWKSFHSNPPEILYHYTNRVGLVGILSNNNIWACNFKELKDETEFTYSCELVLSVLKKVKSKCESEIVTDFIERLEYAFNWYMVNYNIYVACFCGDGNSIIHWDEYAANGAGYAIGFSVKR
jgi:hypothetical protein